MKPINNAMRPTRVINTSLTSPPTAMEVEALPTAHGRYKHSPPVALVVKNPREITIRSDQLTARILLGLLDEKKYIRRPEQNLAEYTQVLSQGRGFVRITLSPLAGEAWSQVLDSLHRLGDELIDTFLVLLAVALDNGGTMHISNSFLITPDDILAICQKKKSKGSYSARQRQNVTKQLQTLARVSVSATLTQHQGKQKHVESPLIQILMTGREEESQTCIGDECKQPWYLRIGDWATMMPEMLYQTAVIPRQLLHYHTRGQRHEKRLGRYLTLLYRINAHKNDSQVKISMGILLEQAGIIPDLDHPGRTQEAIESALGRLRTDGVIGPFTPLVENSSRGREAQERIEQRAYHWWDDYQRQLWLFEPPEYLRTIYQRKSRKSGVPD